MFRPFVHTIIVAIALAQGVPMGPQSYDVPEAYKVYSILLETSNQPILIQGRTIPLVVNPKMLRQRCEFGATAADEFVKVNKSEWVLEDKFTSKTPYTMLSPQDIGEMDSFRNIFGRRYYFIFSPVGFNAEKTIALVAIIGANGRFDGKGRIAVLQKTAGVWREVECGKEPFVVILGRK